MPIYEYECTACGNVEEAFQKISDAPLEQCCQCKGQLNKIVSHSSFQLKGSGWYVTDYGGSASKGSGSAQNAKTDKNKKTGQSCSSSTCGQSCSSSKKTE